MAGPRVRKKKREAKESAKPKARTLAEEVAALDPALRESVRPYVRIVAKPYRKALPLWASKACDGRPYLPRDMPWPKKGKQLMLPVLQIDLANVPALPGFPRKGLLSIFWSEDFSESRVLYFPKIIRDAAKLHADFSAMIGRDLYPFNAAMALTFEKREGCVSWGDHRFDELVGGKAVVTALWDSPNQSKIWDHIWKWSGSGDTRIGGYACPQQNDPRSRGKLKKFETLLLQLENDNFTHCYFIEPAALKRGDFSKILYYETCD